MKKILILIILFSMNSLAVDLSPLKGCYHTVKFNGEYITNGPSEFQSESSIYSVQNYNFLDVYTNKPLRTTVMSFFTGFKNPSYSYTNNLVFDDSGRWTNIGQSYTYSFDGDVYFKTKSSPKEKIDYLIDVNLKVEGDYLHGKVLYKSMARNHFRDFSFVLKRKDRCASFY